MKNLSRIILILALLAATPLFANVSSAQNVAAGAGAAAQASSDDLCVTDPNIHLGARIKPKQTAQIQKTTRLTKLAHARRKHPAQVAAVKICPVNQKAIPVSFVTPVAPAPQQSLCQSAVGGAANVTGTQVNSMMTQAGMDETIANADPDDLAAAATKATQANPQAAPAILAYLIKNIDPNNQEALNKVTKAVYTAAPDQAAGITYAAIATNPTQTMAVTQALLAAAPEADGAVIRQCAIDANPDLANQIATAAHIPSLENPINTTTTPPGVPKAPPDNSAV